MEGPPPPAMSDEDLEANLGISESPLPDNQKISWQEEEDGRELELTSVAINAARYRWRVVCTALRSIRAFSLSAAADQYAIAEDNQNQLQEKLLDITDVEPDFLINLVKSHNINQLRDFGGVEKVASALETAVETGINGNDDESIAQRRKKYGSNRIEKPPPEILKIVLETIRDPLILILLLCAGLSLGFGLIKNGRKGWYDGGSIIFAVFIVTALIAYCKIWPSRKFFKLSDDSDDFKIKVMRNGEEDSISVFDVVVGDVICLKPGDQVPADGLFIYGETLQVEEMESQKLKDSNDDPFLPSGSTVTNGSARMLVTAVGIQTARANMLISSNGYNSYQSNTPLQMELHDLAMLIAKAALASASIVLVCLLIRYFTRDMRDDNGKPEFRAGKTRIHHVFNAMIGMLATPLAIASTAIPEGLLLAVTIPVAYSTYRMAAEKKALVRSLSAWEKIGATTVICTNERGNLTTHKLEVSRFWFGQDTFSSISPNVRESAASVTENMELAIQDWALQQINVDIVQVKKGDPEVMLAKCSQFYDENGHIKEITADVREKLEQIILEMKSMCLQCAAFSCSDVSGEEYLILLGFVGVTHTCPPEIKEAVLDCKSAEVNIKLVTRSELPAARAIAFECGILDPNQGTTTGEVIEGLDFENYPEEEKLEKLDKIRVMARASTLQRRLMVQYLKRKGHVVTVTGDSIGDAVVLKEADVGLSLGIQGTNIAKENSDIIILDDNFVSIATALRWGRVTYYKIQKYTQFQLTVSISSLVIDFVTAISAREPPTIKIVAAISAGKVPFAALQVLWAKLIVGALAALAITIEKPATKLQQVPFVRKNEPFITNLMCRNVVGQALYPIITLLAVHFKGESYFKLDAKVKETMIFNIFVLWQLFNILTTKRFQGIRSEKLFWTIVGTIILLQVVMVELLKKFAGTERLNWKQWAACTGIAFPAWPMGWLVNRINVP